MDRTRKIKDCIWTGSNSLRDQNWESDLPLPPSLRSDCLSKAARITAAKSLKAEDTRGEIWETMERRGGVSCALRFKSQPNKNTVIRIRERADREKVSRKENKAEDFLNIKLRVPAYLSSYIGRPKWIKVFFSLLSFSSVTYILKIDTNVRIGKKYWLGNLFIELWAIEVGDGWREK